MAGVISAEKAAELKAQFAQKHHGSICVANYKGGVGKTTLVCLLGYYLADMTQRKVLFIDRDPQCSLSLAVGFNPDEVSRTELTIYNLVKPSKWTRVKKTKFENYLFPVPDTLRQTGLHIVRGSFDTDKLDMEIAQSLNSEGNRRIDELFLYCKQMLNGFDNFDFILVDCPPNKMFLTQAMLRACSYYLPVTIPDVISVYGLPRLLRWVNDIPQRERPLLLGYVLNAINRTGGLPGGKVYSQQSAENELKKNCLANLTPEEKETLGSDALVGTIPRLDAIARFLGERGAKFARLEFTRKTSGQPTIDECMRKITDVVLKRMETYRAKV